MINSLLGNTLTIDLVVIAQLTFYSLDCLTSEDNLTVPITIQIILWKVVITNSIKAVVNNSIALSVILKSKLLGESDAVVKIVGVHTIVSLSGAQ